jgi:hypothetical protein
MNSSTKGVGTREKESEIPTAFLPSPLYAARREKAPCHLQVKVLPGELSVDPSSYRGGEKGQPTR